MKDLYKIIFIFLLIYSGFNLSAKSLNLDKIITAREGYNLELPTATISGTTTVCLNAVAPLVTFEVKDDSNGPYTFTYTIDGGTPLTIKTINPDKSVTVSAPTNIAGTFTYVLTGVKDKDNNTVDVPITTNSVTITVLDSTVSSVVIQLVEGNFWGTATFNGNQYFTYCSSDANTNGGLFSFTTSSTNTTSNTQHVFDWGDGSQSYTYTGTNLPETFHPYQNSGIYTLKYTIVNPTGCTTVKNYDIYVGASPTATINPGGIPVLCSPGSVMYNILPGAQNSPNTVYTFQVNDGSPAVIFNHPPPATYTHIYTNTSCGTSSTINGTLYPNSFQASIITSNPCGTSSIAFGPINIQTPPDANFTRTPSNNTICKGTTVLFNNTTTEGLNIGAAPTYTCTSTYKKYWVITGPSGNIPVNTDGTLIPNAFISASENFGYNKELPNNSGAWLSTASNQLNITFNTPGTYTITLFTGSNTCGITSEPQTICVNPEVIADFTLSPTTGCAPTTVQLDNLSSLPGCSNTNGYNWQVTPSDPGNCPSATTPGWSFNSGNATAFEPEITFTSPGIYSVQLTTTLQNAVAGVLCQPDVKTQSITIKGKPTTTLTAQTICESTTLTLNPAIYNCYATQAVTYLWDFGSTPPTSISSITAASPIVTFATAGTYNYTLTLTNECGSNVFSSSITVNPAVLISASGPIATCINTAIQLTGSISGGTTNGIWTTSITGGSFSPNTTTLSPTYTPPLNFTGSITFTLTSADPSGPCPSKLISFSVEFNAQATAEAGTYNPVCKNGSLQLNGTVGGAASTGSWTSNNGGVFSDVNSLTSSYTPPAGFIGTIILTLTTNDPDGPCNPETDTVTITVIPTPTINTINDVVGCQNGTVGPITFSGTNAANYTWTNSNTAIGLGASGTSAISFTSTNTGTSPISGIITVTPFNTNGATSCPGTPTTFTITINPKGQVNTIVSQVVCNGDTVTIADFSTLNTGGTTTYTWSSSNTAVGLVASGNGNIGSFTATNTSTAPITTTVTVVPTFSNGSISCVGTSKTVNLTVNPTAQVVQPSNQFFCAGTNTTAISFLTTNTVGTTTYNWTNDTAGIGIGTSGTGNISSFLPINNTTSPITATITVTPTFSNGGTNCTGPSKTFTITINPKGQVNTILNNVFCNGDTIPTISFTTNNTDGTTTYTWTNNKPTIGIGGSGNGDIPSFTAINTGTTPIVATITVTPSFTSTNSCSGTPIPFTITINPSAQVNTIPNKTVCNNGTQTAINFGTTNTGGTTTYTWTNDTTSIGLGATGNGNIAAFTATNTGTSPITANIVVTPSYTNNGISCSGATKTFTITANPSAQVNANANQILCNGTSTNAVTFSTNNTGGTTTYTWSNSNTAIGLPATGSGNINVFNVTNSTASPISATITVTPSFANGTPACSGLTQSFTITVNPSPIVSFSTTNQTICSGDTSALVTLSSTTSGATFSWTAVQPAGITTVATSGLGTIPAQTLTNTTNAPITITYAAVATTNDASVCQGSTYNYTITVKPRPSITESFADSTCSGGTFTSTPVNSSINSIPVGTTYSWISPTVTDGLTGGVSGLNQTSISGTLINPTNTVQSATYSVIPSFNGCSGTAFSIVISVNPKPVIPNVVPNAICSVTPFIVTPTNAGNTIVPNGTTYTWTISSNTNITGQSASSNVGVTSISQTLTNITNTTQIIVYTVTPTSGDTGNCVGTPFTITVSVNPKPFIVNSTPIICSGTAFSVTPANGSGVIVPTGTTYTWTTPLSNPAGAITGGNVQLTGVNAISQTLNNTTNSPATLEYTVTPTAGVCSGNSFTITVTVNPTPTTLSLVNQTYCNNVPTTEIVFTNGVSGTTYAWTNSKTSIGLGASGTGNIPVFTPTNTTNAPITATISVIATANGCTRTAETLTITVNPSPMVSFSPTNQTICSGDTSALVNLSSTTSGATFSWTAVQPAEITGVITSETNTIPFQTLTNSTNLPIVVTYIATAESNSGINCQGIPYPYTITVNPVPSITTTQTQTICSNTTFSINPLDGGGNIIPVGTTYTWGVPTVTGGITGGAALSNQTTIKGTLINPTDTAETATYTVTPKSGTCIGASFTVVITVNPSPKVIFSGDNQTVCSGVGSLPITLSSPTIGTVTFNWIANIPAGISGASASGTGTIPTQTLVNTTTNSLIVIYTATTTLDNNGVLCTGQTFDYKITVNPAIVTSSILSNFNGFNVSSDGATDGAINVTVTGGSGAYTYLWSGPNGYSATIQDISNVAAGTYILTINDGFCNPFILNFNLTSPMPLLIQEDTAAHIDILCFGYLTGAIKVDITQQSVGPYDYVLNLQGDGTISTITDSAVINHTFTGLAAGTYDVKVTDANGSVKTIIGIIITQPSGITATISAQTNVSCAGSATGSATVTASGGIGTLTYSWNTIPIQTTATAIGLTAGTYTVTITDANTCSIQKQAIIMEPNSVLTSIASQTNVLCYENNTGSATILASGGTGILTYSWDTIPAQSTATATGLLAGTYNVTVTDANGCSKAQMVIITEPSAGLTSMVSNSTNVSCFGGNDGSGTITVSGGTVPYYYSWNTVPTQTLSKATGLKAGNYSVAITDTNGCSITTSVTITEPAVMTASITAQTNVFCSGNNTGSATVTATGGTAPFTYSWNTTPIQTSDVAVNLAIGTYTVTVTDSKGCTTSTQATITEPNEIVTSIASQTNVDCFGKSTGAVTVLASGGTETLTYSWDTIPVQTSLNATGLIAGTYHLTVTDANNCTKIQPVTITQPADITIATDLEKDITCFNDANGAINITITGGTLNYNYAWTKNGTAYATSEDLANLSPGIYVVTVSDTNNCGPKTATFTITEPPILAVSLVSKTNILCFGESTGAINVNATGGTPAISGYNFAWTGPNGFTSSNKDLVGIAAGTYNLAVTDISGCSKSLSVTLSQPTAIVLTATTTPIICYSANDASITLAINGGITPYAIVWSNLGAGTFQDNLSAGDYLITVTDSNNCSKTLNVNIPEAPIFTINPVVKNITCFGDENGSINLNIVGGILPIKLVWDDNSTAGNVRNNLGPGSYTVTIVDSKPCSIKRTFIILEPQLLALSANVTNAFDCDNANSGAINLLVAGGTAPFTYSWSNGITTEDLANVPAGNYLVTVKDANDCSKQAQYSINRPPPIITEVVTKTEFDCDAKYIKQNFVAQVSGGVTPYLFEWSSGTVSGANNEIMNTSQNGTVILYVTDAIGCKSNYSFNVKLQSLGTPSYNASSYYYSTFGSYSINDPIQFTNTATGDYISVAWDFGDGSVSTDPNPVHIFINPKDYVVTQTVTYPFGCIYVQKTTFIVEKGYLLVVPNAFTPNDDKINDTFRPVTKALKNVRLDIYDTWGSLIYSEKADVLRGWDGKIKGFKAENGNYFCKVSGETFYGTIVNVNHPFVLIK